MPHFDAIVVGIGGMGSAACYQLAKRGQRVLGLEQFDIPHTRGSSHGFSRMIRQAYHEHSDYVPLLRRAYELWRGLEDESSQQLLHVTGGVYIGRQGSARLSRTAAAAESHHLPYEHLSRAQLADRYPQFHLPDDYEAIYEPAAGFLRPEACVAAHTIAALRRGAEIHAHETVISWKTDGDSVKVRTDKGSYEAARLIFCSGAWSGSLLRELGVKLVVTRQVLGWVWPRRPELFELGKFPVWSIARDDETSHYGFPMMPDNPGFKTAHHWRAAAVDPDQAVRDPMPGDEADFRDVIDRYLPDANGPLLGVRVCLYTNSPDGHFIIDRHPRHERVLLACGFSGHGFKFCSVVGELLADLAVDGKSNLRADFLGLRRLLT